MTNKDKNLEIELFRFIFCILVMFSHFHCTFVQFIYFDNGWIGTDFFFLLSGLLMAKSANQVCLDNTFDLADKTRVFLLKKVKTVYLYFIGVVLFEYFNRIFLDKLAFKDIVRSLVDDFPKLFFLNMFGWYPNAADPTWYLSAMVISCAILFPFLLYNYSLFTKLIFPIFGFLLMGNQFIKSNNVSQITDWYGLAYGGMVRALALMMLGGWLLEVSNLIEKISITKVSKILLTIIKWIGLFGIMLYASLKIPYGEGYIAAIILEMIVIILSWSNATYKVNFKFLAVL